MSSVVSVLKSSNGVAVVKIVIVGLAVVLGVLFVPKVSALLFDGVSVENARQAGVAVSQFKADWSGQGAEIVSQDGVVYAVVNGATVAGMDESGLGV